MSFDVARDAPEPPSDLQFGLMTSLPIYRAPQASVSDMLAVEEEDPHWLRAALEGDNSVEPIDALDPASLSGTDVLLLIQPRALSPAENVALDAWVRDGGQVLLVADPMLVSEPPFALGDPRNPQAISVSGPILARWGLTLRPDESSSHGHGHGHGIDGDGKARAAEIDDEALPVLYGGTFALRAPAGGDPADCALQSGGILAVCEIGAGRAVLLADATLFESRPASREEWGPLWAMLGKLRD